MKVTLYDKVWFHGNVRPAEYTLPITGIASKPGKVTLTRVIDDWEDTLFVEGHGSVPKWEVPWTHVACAVRSAAGADRPTAPAPPETKPETKPEAKPAPRTTSTATRRTPQQRPKLSAAQMLAPKVQDDGA